MTKKLTALGLFAAGAGIGAAVALLYAPRAGKHTRARLRNTANRTLHRAEEVGQEIRGCMSELVDDASALITTGKDGARATGECLLRTFDQIREGVDEGRTRVQECIRSVMT